MLTFPEGMRIGEFLFMLLSFNSYSAKASAISLDS